MIAAFIFFRIIKSCKSRTGAAEPGAGADFACTLPGLPVRAGIYCEAKIIQAAPTAKFIWRLWPCGLFSREIGAHRAYLRPVLFCCPPPPCPVSSARRVAALLRYVRSLRHAAPLSPHRGHRITCCPPLHRFPPRPFPGHPSSSAFFPRYPPYSWQTTLFCICPAPVFPFLASARPRPPPSLLVPSRPFSSLLVPSRPVSSLLVPSRPFLSRLVPSCPVSSPPPISLFPAPVVPAVFSGDRRFWHENAKYFFIWEIIVNFLLLLAFNVK